MANKNALNKNSTYVQSLVSFILDTKPYHSKLTEIVEEYQFFDDVKVKIDERLTSRTKASAVWMYNYFSAANSSFRSMPAKRLLSPSFNTTSYIVGADENTDLALVPYAYSKKSFDGPGVSGVFLRHGDFTERLIESHDYFQSHGSFQFQIKQIRNAMGRLEPLWSSGEDEGVITWASGATQQLALDASQPNSSISRIRSLLEQIQQAILEAGGHAEAQRELTGAYVYNPDVPATADSLFGILDSGTLPRSYEGLLAWLALPNSLDVVVPLPAVSWPIPADPVDSRDREWFERQFSNNTSPLFFNMFSDLGARESGLGNYPTSATSDYIKLTEITIPEDNDLENWIIASEPGTTKYSVVGSVHGFLGFFDAGDTFTSARIYFKSESLGVPIGVDQVKLNPARKIVIGSQARMETWNIIKVNPIAHSRPVLSSKQIGYIKDLNNKVGNITIVNTAFNPTNITMTARADGVTFDVVNADRTYVAVATAGVPFNDGELAFTIVLGLTPFVKGERFYFSIENKPPEVQDLDLGYGYDLDPYDDNLPAADDEYGYDFFPTRYTAPSTDVVGFNYDGRFTDYDVTQMNVVVQPYAVNGRKWRARPFRAMPGNSALIGTYNEPGRPGPARALNVYYADGFTIEASDDDFKTIALNGGNVPIDGSYFNEEQGVSFKLPRATRPFVVATGPDDFKKVVTPGDYGGEIVTYVPTTERVVGGDTFTFTVVNPEPRVVESSIDLITDLSRPHLQLHSDGFASAPDASWRVEFISDTEYYITASKDSRLIVLPIFKSLTTSHSYQENGIHFSIFPGSGAAAGDIFTFDTYAKRPSYLVHGSYTGWTAPATVGEYYWNGSIGFTIPAPFAETFVPAEVATHNGIDRTLWNVSDLGIDFSVSDDCLSMTYNFTRSSKGYIVTRSDTGEITFAPFESTYEDRFLKLNLAGVTTPEFRLVVNAHDFRLWNGGDLVILKPSAARVPESGAVVLVEKTEESRFGLNMSAGAANLTDLGPISIDPRFIGLETGGIPLSNTSPETALLTGWIPTMTKKMVNATDTVVFNDPAVRFEFTSAISNEPIGVLSQLDPTNANEPIAFEWDEAFFRKYLPLNAEANIVINNTGWNDKVFVRISESIKFLLGSGALAEDWMFTDMVNVKIKEDHGFNITTRSNDNFSVEIEDGPFGGFLPGFDNLPYEGERGDVGAYDAGQPPDIYSLMSRFGITAQDRRDVLARWNNFLLNDELPTTEEQWAYLREQLAIDPTIDILSTSGFGMPVLGKGMDIMEKPVNTASTKFLDAMVSIGFDEANFLESKGYGSGELDSQDEVSMVASGGSLPVQPTVIPPDATYETFHDGIELPVAAAKHLQTSASQTWFIPSKLKGVIKEVSVIDLTGASLTPLTVDFINGIITLTFAQPQAGRATITIQTTSRLFDISFTADTEEELEAFTPHLSIWLPGEPAPTQVQIVERLEAKPQVGQLIGNGLGGKSSRLFRFSFARPTEGKIIVG